MQSLISNSESRVFHPSCQNQRYQWYPWSSILLSDLHVRVVSFFAGQRVTSESYQRLHSREDPFSRRGNLSVLHKGHQWWWRHSGARTVCLLSVLTNVFFSNNHLPSHYIHLCTVLRLFKSVLWMRMMLGRIFESSWWTQDQKWKVGKWTIAGCNNYCATIASPLVGRECLRKLVKSGIKCSYVLVNAVSYIMKEVGKKITNPGLSHDSLFMSLGLQGDHRSSCLIGQWLCHVSYRHCPDSPGGQVLQCPSARLLWDLQILWQSSDRRIRQQRTR